MHARGAYTSARTAAQLGEAPAQRRARDAELTRRLDAPWVVSIESYNARWHAHRFEARTPSDVDAIAELPALLCEGYHDLGQQESVRRSRTPAAG